MDQRFAIDFSYFGGDPRRDVEHEKSLSVEKALDPTYEILQTNHRIIIFWLYRIIFGCVMTCWEMNHVHHFSLRIMNMKCLQEASP